MKVYREDDYNELREEFEDGGQRLPFIYSEIPNTDFLTENQATLLRIAPPEDHDFIYYLNANGMTEPHADHVRVMLANNLYINIVIVAEAKLGALYLIQILENDFYSVHSAELDANGNPSSDMILVRKNNVPDEDSFFQTVSTTSVPGATNTAFVAKLKGGAAVYGAKSLPRNSRPSQHAALQYDAMSIHLSRLETPIDVRFE